jgi:PAS domain-containing protein
MSDGGQKLAAAVSKAELRGRVYRAQSPQWELFQKALDSLPEGIAVLEGDTLRLRWANRAFYQHMGEPDPGVSAGRLHDFVPQAEESGLAEIFRRVAATGQACSDLEYEYNDFLNGPTYWRFALRPLPSDDLQVAVLAVKVENITAEVMARASKEQRRARVRLRQDAHPVVDRQPIGQPKKAPVPAAPATAAVDSVALQLGSWRYR